MKKRTEEFLHEARVALDDAGARFTMINSMTAFGAAAVFGSAELGIKTVVAEKYDSIPRSWWTHDIVGLAEKTGLWGELPAHLQDHLTAMAPFDPDVRYPGSTAYDELVTAGSPKEWERRLAQGRQLLDHIESKVLGDPAAFSRLKL